LPLTARRCCLAQSPHAQHLQTAAWHSQHHHWQPAGEKKKRGLLLSAALLLVFTVCDATSIRHPCDILHGTCSSAAGTLQERRNTPQHDTQQYPLTADCDTALFV
jgi:hypothetical protein